MIRLRCACLLLVAMMLTGYAARAASLVPEVAGSYLSTPGARVLVIAAGRYLDALPFAQEVQQALIFSGSADEVKLDPQFSHSEALSDPELIAQLGGALLDEVAIVRVRPDQPSIAQVHLYRLNGQPLSEFEFGADIVLLPRIKPLGLSRKEPGVPREKDPREEPIARQRTQVSYELGYLSLRDVQRSEWRRYRGRSRKYTKTVMVATQGNTEEIVAWEIFYELVNRPDLLKQYQQRENTSRLLGAIGGVTLVASLPLLVTGGATTLLDDKRTAYSLLGIGSGLFLTGLTELLIAHLRSPHPVSREELQRLADQHNQALQARFQASPLSQ